MTLGNEAISSLGWDDQGLIPAIVQDANSRAVLMMAYMNAESLRRTLELGEGRVLEPKPQRVVA